MIFILQILTTRYDQTIHSLNEQLRVLCDSNLEKNHKIHTLTKQLSEAQIDCERYEVEINKLIKEKHEKNSDMLLLSEAFEKRGFIFFELHKKTNPNLFKPITSLI